jgi:transcriptional regulator with XRE-family HTH domain
MGAVAGQPAHSFGELLRQLRDEAGLTQEQLAEAATLSPRSISDLERGINRTSRNETARLLAGALGLTGSKRAQFEAAARGRALGSAAAAESDLGGGPAVTRTLPPDWAMSSGSRRTIHPRPTASSGRWTCSMALATSMAGVGLSAASVLYKGIPDTTEPPLSPCRRLWHCFVTFTTATSRRRPSSSFVWCNV